MQIGAREMGASPGRKFNAIFAAFVLSPAIAGLETLRVLTWGFTPGFMLAPASQAKKDFSCKANQCIRKSSDAVTYGGGDSEVLKVTVQFLLNFIDGAYSESSAD